MVGSIEAIVLEPSALWFMPKPARNTVLRMFVGENAIPTRGANLSLHRSSLS